MSPPRHDRDSVTDVALALLDRVGLPDLSMRRLAAELDVQPSALYWHFTSKQALLAAVADRILVGIPEAPGDPAELAARIRDALLSYRDGAEVVLSSIAMGLGADRPRAVLAEALRRAGADSPDAAASIMLQFILGHALLVQQRLHAAGHGAGAHDEPDATAAVDATFDRGIRMLLVGAGAALPR